MVDLISQFHDKWQKTIESFRIDIASVRSNRVSPSLVEDIMVDAYGQQMAIKQLAAISVQSAGSLIIQPWDQTVVLFLEKALRESAIGVMPTSEGNLIRLNFPPLTQ